MALCSLSSLSLSETNTKFSLSSVQQRRPRSPIASLTIGFDDIVELAHNKVLVAATVSATIGHLSKPFTSAIRGDGFNLKSLVQSGGMPSTHSASVVAAATSLGLERGFSDSIFGMSVVCAALVMYDAQGVRREVGTHAKILNRILKTQENKSLHLEQGAFTDFKTGTSSVNSEEIAPVFSLSEKKNSCTSNSESYLVRASRTTSNNLGAIPSLDIDVKEAPEKMINDDIPLNESVGHTKIQVLVGAFLGIIVAAAATHEASPAKVYWNKALPNTPMPASISGLLKPVDRKVSAYRITGPYSPVLEKDMVSGTNLTMDFVRPTSAFGSTLLPRQAAKSLPFSSTKLSAIFAHFSIDPESLEANSIKKTINECEAPPAYGERKFCATSLESMVEYTTSVLATRNVLTLSTIMSYEDVPRQKYIIVSSGVKKLSGSNFVACHARKYPYAVFYCHTTKKTSAYRVSAVGEDGTAVEAVAVCHDVIAGPDSYGTKFKAGDPFCHLLPPDHVVWMPKN